MYPCLVEGFMHFHNDKALYSMVESTSWNILICQISVLFCVWYRMLIIDHLVVRDNQLSCSTLIHVTVTNVIVISCLSGAHADPRCWLGRNAKHCSRCTCSNNCIFVLVRSLLAPEWKGDQSDSEYRNVYQYQKRLSVLLTFISRMFLAGQIKSPVLSEWDPPWMWFILWLESFLD